MEHVAAVVRDHVDLHAADRRFGRERARLIADLLHQAVVEIKPGLIAAEADVLNLHAVDHEHVVVVRRAVHLERRLLHDLRAADVGRLGRDAGNQLPDGERILARRNGVELLAVHHRLRDRTVDVDQRRGAGDGDRLLELTECQLGVDSGGERRGQRDTVAPERAEAGEGERDRVVTRSEIDDAVAAGIVGDGRARAFDERGAGGLHGHTGQHGA